MWARRWGCCKAVRCWGWVMVTGILLWGTGLAAQERPTVEERLIRLEEGQKGLAQRIEGIDRSLNQRIEDLRTDMNQRFGDLNFWLQLIFGTIFATLGAVLVQWATTVRRTDRLATRLEEHLRETEKLQQLEARLERLEASRQA